MNGETKSSSSSISSFADMSTVTRVFFFFGRLHFNLGDVVERELDKLKYGVGRFEKSFFAFACYMDRQ